MNRWNRIRHNVSESFENFYFLKKLQEIVATVFAQIGDNLKCCYGCVLKLQTELDLLCDIQPLIHMIFNTRRI